MIGILLRPQCRRLQQDSRRDGNSREQQPLTKHMRLFGNPQQKSVNVRVGVGDFTLAPRAACVEAMIAKRLISARGLSQKNWYPSHQRARDAQCSQEQSKERAQ